MANAADIIVNLVAKTGSLTRGLTKGTKKLKTFEKGASSLQRTVKRLSASLIAGFGAGLSVRGIVNMTKEVIALNDELGKFSTRLGIDTDELKILQIAADLSGQSVASLTVGLQRMVRRVNEAAVGTGEAKQAIIDLGLSAKTLATQTPDQVFRAIGVEMETVASQGLRVATGFKLLDTEGVGLVNTMKLLNTEGFKAIEQSVRDMNAVMSDFKTASFEAAADALTLASLGFEGVKNTVAFELLPATILWRNAITDTATELGGTNTTISETVIKVVQVAGALVGVFKLFVAIGRLIVSIGLRFITFVLKPIEGLEQLLRIIRNLGAEGLNRVAVGAKASGIAIERAGGGLKGFLTLLTGRGLATTNFAGIAAEAREATEDLIAPVDPENTLIGAYRNSLLETAKDQADLLADFKNIVGESDAFVASWFAARVEIAEAATGIAAQRAEMATMAADLLEQLEIRRLLALEESATAARLNKLAALVRGTLTAEEIIKGKIRLIDAALLAGEGDRIALLETRIRLEQEIVDLKDKDNNLSEVGIQAARNLQDAFAQFFLFTETGFKGLLSSFVDMLRKMIAELLARQVLLSFFRAFAKPGNFASKVVKDIEGKRHGGPLARGQPAIVGEGGPELFIPGSSGTVIPNGRFGGISVTNNITVNGADPERSAQILAPLLAANRQQTLVDLAKLRERGRF
jgi:hypothetical protein